MPFVPGTTIISGPRQTQRQVRNWKVILGIAGVVVLVSVMSPLLLVSKPTPRALPHGPSPTTSTVPAEGSAPTPTFVVGPKITLPPTLYIANPPGSAQLVTPAQADQIATAMWQLRESSLISGDTTALTQLDAPGLLLNGDLYACAELTACGDGPSPRPIDSLIPVVPVQRAYPLDFLAEVGTETFIPPTGADAPGIEQLPSAPGIELDIFTKATPSASWRLSFETDYAGVNGGDAPDTPFDFAGSPIGSGASTPRSFNPAPTATPPVPVGEFLPLLAAYWQSWKDVQGPPPNTVFAPGAFTSQFGSEIGQDPQGTFVGGYPNTYTYAYDPTQGTWTFSAQGFPVVCGTVLASATATALHGQVLIQDAGRTNWGVPLSPGAYTSITSEKTHQSCVLGGPGGQLVAEGNDGSEVNVTGVPLIHPTQPAPTDQA
jgi:hypothetical protein